MDDPVMPDWASDMVDLHAHAAPSLLPRHGNEVQTVAAERAVGFTTVVLKSHEGSTVERAATVAQDDGNLAAERGLSPFDRRHQVSADVSYELPFGPQRRWINGDGLLPHLVAHWQVAATFAAVSGTPYTARVLGDTRDVSRGTNGTLRADVTGVPVVLADPTIGAFFDTAAFARPSSGAFGDAGRNTIIGPGSRSLDASLIKSIPLGQRTLTARLQATNVLNAVQFGAIDTVVNSPTFGQVVSIRPMRSVQFDVRFRF